MNKTKIMYAEFISLAEEEYSTLVNKFGEENAKKCIETLNKYKKLTAKRYVSDYKAITFWVIGSIIARKQHTVLSSLN